MDPYRTSFSVCPTCGFGLRDFGKRRICDGCGGMLIERGDLLASVSDLGVLELDVSTHEEVAATCPGCGHALRRAEIVMDKRAVPPEVLACEQHGVWLGGGALLTMMTEVSRRARPRSAAAVPVADWMNAPAFRGGLVPHRAPASQPSVHTPLASAHIGRSLACPECKGRLVRSGMAWMCSEHGALVEEIALDAMIGEMTGSPWERPVWTNRAGARPCPACGEAMAIESLDGVEVDRCAQDGVWLDPGELETVLARSSDRGRKGWVGRLFRRGK